MANAIMTIIILSTLFNGALVATTAMFPWMLAESPPTPVDNAAIYSAGIGALNPNNGTLNDNIDQTQTTWDVVGLLTSIAMAPFKVTAVVAARIPILLIPLGIFQAVTNALFFYQVPLKILLGSRFPGDFV